MSATAAVVRCHPTAYLYGSGRIRRIAAIRPQYINSAGGWISPRMWATVGSGSGERVGRGAMDAGWSSTRGRRAWWWGDKGRRPQLPTLRNQRRESKQPHDGPLIHDDWASESTPSHRVSIGLSDLGRTRRSTADRHQIQAGQPTLQRRLSSQAARKRGEFTPAVRLSRPTSPAAIDPSMPGVPGPCPACSDRSRRARSRTFPGARNETAPPPPHGSH